MSMFKGLGTLFSLLSNPQRIQEEAEAVKQRLAQLSADGDAGGGMVKVKVNGKMELQAITLTDDAMKMADREMLEDMIKAAANQALAKIRQQSAEEYQKMALNLGLPAGVNIPGLGMPGMG
jgi:DNA-binding YbaB/EbfC family protein